MKRIQIQGGYEAEVSNEDYELLNRFTWRLIRPKKGGDNVYACLQITMHRMIMNDPKGMTIDHIDGNGLNNQRSNLRVCTKQQNSLNRKKRSEFRGNIACSSIYKGVSYNKNKNRWVATISINGQQKHIGTFSTELEASDAYDTVAKECHGEYANLNNA